MYKIKWTDKKTKMTGYIHRVDQLDTHRTWSDRRLAVDYASMLTAQNRQLVFEVVDA